MTNRSTWLHILIISVVGILAYSNTFHVPFVLDDKPSIVENHVIRSLQSFFAGNGGWHYNSRRFVGYLSFALNYRLGGLNVTGYHLVNLAIHLVTSLLVYYFCRLTFETPFLKNSRLAGPATSVALIAALLFVAHPIQTQAVTYISQRFAALATMFYLLTMTLYASARLCQVRRKAAFLLTLSFCSLLLAMLTKEIAFTLPLMLVLYDFSFFGGDLRKKLVYLVPLLLPIGIIPFTLLNTRVPLGKLLADMDLKLNVYSELSRGTYLLTQFRVIATYIRLLFLPVNQNLDYAYPVYRSLFEPGVFCSFLLIAFLISTAVFLFVRSRRSPEPALRVAGFGIFWFFVTLAVESSVIPIVDVIFEHRLYLPLVGACLSVASGLALVLRQSRTMLAVAGIVTLVLAAATWKRNLVWGDEVTLWRDTVDKSPGKGRPHNNLGEGLRRQGRIEEAERQVAIAVTLNPRSAEARSNLGAAYLDRGERERALEQLQTAVELSPNLFAAHYNLGIVYSKLERTNEAIEQFIQALRINPDVAEAHNQLAAGYAAKEKLDLAIEHFREAVRLNPDKADYRKNLELALQKK